MSEQTILVIDDDASIHSVVEERLEGVVGRVLFAATPGDGIRMTLQHKPDAILLDINMPDMDGYKVCRHLKEHSGTRDIPILFLTVDRKMDNLAKALDCGGSDYILKPLNFVELEARVRAALRTKRMFDLLREQARIDALTGLKNRAALDDALVSATAAYHRTGQPMALLMIDLDDFKEINDRFGHGVGDDVLREIGSTLRTCVRPYDIACRFGGDEFTIVLGQVEGSLAEHAATRIIEAIAEVSVRSGGVAVGVSSSGGLASSAELRPNFEPADVLKVADAALYRAKHEGRARLVVASSPGA